MEGLSLIENPLFYLLAIPAVLMVGIAVGWWLRPERERVVEVAGAERVVPVVVPGATEAVSR